MSTPITAGHPVHLLDENGNPYGIKQIDGKPRVSAMQYTYDIAEGNIADHAFVRKFGHNDDVGATQETLWSSGGLYPWPASAEILKVSSSDADDDGSPVGDGARTIQLFGLDANYALQDEIIILNGLGSVSTGNSYLRVYRAKVMTAGDSGWNEGTISVKDNADSVTLLSIEPLKNQTLAAIFTIPDGNTGYITSWFAATSANKVVEVELFIRPFGEAFQIKTLVELNQQPYKDEWEFPEPVTAKSDIEVRATAVGGGGTVSGGFSLWYE
jgi:hypothetical protein